MMPAMRLPHDGPALIAGAGRDRGGDGPDSGIIHARGAWQGCAGRIGAGACRRVARGLFRGGAGEGMHVHRPSPPARPGALISGQGGYTWRDLASLA